ncbi:MAG: hypothetical protein HY466_00610 [Deltaproteobacteria bacterium]|nr:hypothetical protein [Deltaproteobacteria bacterium]
MKSHNGMRPQDVAVLLKIVALSGEPWRHIDLAQHLNLSQSEVSEALDRCKLAGLVSPDKKRVIHALLFEFLVYGLKYVFPVEPGAVCLGVPTAHSMAPLNKKIVSKKEEQYVWPAMNGKVRGHSIRPLYKKIAEAAEKDQKFHELLALVDAIRVGRAREQKLAIQELKKRILENK